MTVTVPTWQGESRCLSAGDQVDGAEIASRYSVQHLYRIACVIFAGCATTTAGAHPDDMSAAEHDQTAAQHEEESNRHGEQFEPSQSRSSSGSSLLLGTDFGTDVYNPTEGHLVEADEHAEIAAQHRAAAQALRDFEGEACAPFPESTRASCPLLHQLVGVEDVPGGARLAFSADVNLDAVFHHIRCHIAFARVRGRQGMDGCPMYVEGARVERSGSEISLVTDGAPEDVAALRRATRAHLP